MNELVQRVLIAVAGGAVPQPIPGESVEDLRFRCAHAGAIIGLQYSQEREAAHQQAAAARAAAAATEQGHHGDTDTVTSPPEGRRHGDGDTVTSPVDVVVIDDGHRR